MIILTLLSAIALHIAIRSGLEFVEREETKYENAIGTEVLIKNDLMTVVDYSLINKTFTLSDGRTVSAKLIFDQAEK